MRKSTLIVSTVIVPSITSCCIAQQTTFTLSDSQSGFFIEFVRDMGSDEFTFASANLDGTLYEVDPTDTGAYTYIELILEDYSVLGGTGGGLGFTLSLDTDGDFGDVIPGELEVSGGADIDGTLPWLNPFDAFSFTDLEDGSYALLNGAATQILPNGEGIEPYAFDSLTITSIPLPTGCVLAAVGLAGIGVLRPHRS